MAKLEDPIAIVILAGGQGTRFWPVSRRSRPKQFLSIAQDGESLIQATARRTRELSASAELVVVTNEMHQGLIREHLPAAQVLTEPVGRNTAAAIGLAATYLSLKNPNALMVVLPADQLVSDDAKLRQSLELALTVATKSDYLVTIGITPDSPNTGFGYIRRGSKLNGSPAYKVSRFFEKPNLERAKEYCDSGQYLWNAGMFVFRANMILKAIEQYLPDLAKGLNQIKECWGKPEQPKVTREVFEGLENISIDFGVMEHARNCAVVAAEPMGWSDVGSWDAWAERFPKDGEGNLIKGTGLIIDSKNCVVHAPNKLIAVLGAENLIVIDSGDALLVCTRESVQNVRKIVDELKKQGREDLT